MAIHTVVDGRLGADSEVKYSNDGKPRLTMRMATDSGFGENKKTDWVSVTLFGKRAESLAPHLVKGKQVLVTGTLNGREYEGTKGKVFSLDLVANDITFLGGGKGDNQTATTNAAPATETTSTQNYETSPF